MSEIKLNDLKIETPFRGFISGPSGAGKSAFILRFLENRTKLCTNTFEKVIYCSLINLESLSAKDESFLSELKNRVPYIEIYSGLPTLSELIESPHKGTLLILDDLITDVIGSEKYAKLFTSFSAHSNISVLTTSQNFFEQGKYATTIIRNQTFYVLFFSRNDNQTINVISKRMFPHDKHFLRNCFHWINERVTEQFKKYIFIDCSNNTKLPPTFPQVRTNMFNECNFFSPLFLCPE